MNKKGKFKFFGFVGILVVALIFMGTNFDQAQVKPEKKPFKCNYNGICEKWESSDCPDCQPPPPSPPLELDHSGFQIVAGSSDKKVYHIKYMYGEYTNTWFSNKNDHRTPATSIGDVDNDGFKEITTVVNYKKSTGPPKNRVSYQKIFVYEDGSTGEPNYTSHNLGWSTNGVRDSLIADADNDGQNELILVEDKHIEIYEWNGSGFSELWNSPEYDYFIWSVDVGDADNDGANEVVLAMFHIGSAIVYEYLGENTWGNPVTTESIGSCNIDQAKVRDADNDGYNEIVGGGTSNKLNVWEYIDGAYVNVFLSEDLGGFTQGVDAGDIDGDTYNEVIAGASIGGESIYVFEYDFVNDTYLIIDSISVSGVGRLEVGDLDNDGKDEIASSGKGITVFDFIDGLLKYTYNFPYAYYLEIG